MLQRIIRLSVRQSCIAYRKYYVPVNKEFTSHKEEPDIYKENDYLHKCLEEMEVYQDHLIPHPKYYFAPQTASKSRSGSETRNILRTQKIYERHKLDHSSNQLSRSINIQKLFLNTDLNNASAEYENEGGKSSLSNILSAYKGQCLKVASQPHLLNDAKFEKLVESVKKNVPLMSYLELTQTMVYSCLWSLSSIKMGKKFTFMWKALDRETTKRYDSWNIQQRLLIGDLWYHLHLGKNTLFTSSLVQDIQENLTKLSTPELIHLLFITNLKREASSQLMVCIEPKIETILPNLSIEELAVIAVSFFKTSTKILSRKINTYMAERLIEVMPTVNHVALVCIIKNLRYSFIYENKEIIIALLQAAAKEKIWQNNFTIATHLCLLTNTHSLWIPEILDDIVNDMIGKDNIRLKDLEKVLLTLTKSNILKPGMHSHVFKFFKNELQDPKREKEKDAYPYPYLSCILYLAYMGKFFHKEINHVLNPQFFDHLEKKISIDFRRELATLDCLVEIDEPMYTGKRLDPCKRFEILKTHQMSFPTKKATFRETITMNLAEGFQIALDKKVPMLHILPYMDDPVFLLISDKKGQFYDPPEEFLNKISKGEIVGPMDKRDWVVFWLITKNDQHGNLGLTALSETKKRHFQKLGFRLVIVPWEIFGGELRVMKFITESLMI